MALNRRPQRLYVLAAVLAGLAIVLGAFSLYRLALEPVSNNQTLVFFDIKPGDKATAVAQHLQAAKLIRDRRALLLYLDLHGQRPKLQAGTYALKPSYSVPELVELLTNGNVKINRILVPEGTTLAQIRALALDKGLPADQFDAALAGDYGKDFLIGRPAAITLEGYLFPDTYQLDPGTSSAQLVKAMVDNFDRKVTIDLRQAFTDQGFTLHQGVTLASMVEKEVANAADRPVVAGIFARRLKLGQPLESDVTVHYGAALLGQQFSTNLNSPYNTYRHAGLPPGPICNPGLDALKAAAHPAATDYLYFVAGKDGTTHFAKTFAEHQANVAKYLTQ